MYVFIVLILTILGDTYIHTYIVLIGADLASKKVGFRECAFCFLESLKGATLEHSENVPLFGRLQTNQNVTPFPNIEKRNRPEKFLASGMKIFLRASFHCGRPPCCSHPEPIGRRPYPWTRSQSWTPISAKGCVRGKQQSRGAERPGNKMSRT